MRGAVQIKPQWHCKQNSTEEVTVALGRCLQERERERMQGAYRRQSSGGHRLHLNLLKSGNLVEESDGQLAIDLRLQAHGHASPARQALWACGHTPCRVVRTSFRMRARERAWEQLCRVGTGDSRYNGIRCISLYIGLGFFSISGTCFLCEHPKIMYLLG